MNKSPIKKFKINRKTWLRPKKGTAIVSLLLNKEGKKCCLGFYAMARSLKKHDLLLKISPRNLRKKNDSKKLPELCYRDKNSKITKKLMLINDNPNTTDKHKEKYIKYNFKKLGVEVEFYN